MKIEEALDPTGKAERHDGADQFVMKNEAGILVWSSKRTGFIDCGVTLGTILANDWQPYHEVKEIRPEKAGELWEGGEGKKYFTYKTKEGLLLIRREDNKWYDIPHSLIHGKDGWTRESPKVEDDSVEVIEVEGISFGMEVGDRRVFIKEWDKIKYLDILDRPPFKMTLETPKI